MRYLYLLLVPLLAVPAHAQSLTDAFASAWRRSPQGAAEARRLDEAQARRDAGASWLRESPSLAAGYKTDQIDRNAGGRELELELGLPIALPGDRARALAVGTAEADAVQATLAAERLRVAGEVREAYWTLHVARIEREQAQRRAEELQALAQDVELRARVGELARVDALQSQAALLAAQSTVRTAELDVQRAARAFKQLTGLPGAPGTSVPESSLATPDLPAHPWLRLARTQRDAAEARARQASEVRRDAPELAITLSRERDDFTAAYGNAIRVGVKVPLGTNVRNRVRIAETGAQRIEAETDVQRTEVRVASELQDAQDAVAVARDALAAARERAQLATQAQALIGRAFALGERDLAARLRADAEQHEAELAAARAQVELGRATSRLNQAAGVLP